MSEKRPDDRAAEPVSEVQPDEWPAWCERASADLGGRGLVLRFADEALGDVQLAEDQPLVAIEYDELGPMTALTIKYGDGVVPRTYVIANPRELIQEHDASGELREVKITDSTGRRTCVSLAG